MSQLTKKTDELSRLENEVAKELPLDKVSYRMDFDEMLQTLDEELINSAERRNACECILAKLVKRAFAGYYTHAAVFPKSVRVANVAAMRQDGFVDLFQIRCSKPIAAIYDGSVGDAELVGEKVSIAPTPLSAQQGYQAPGTGPVRSRKNPIAVTRDKVISQYKRMVDQSRDWRRNWDVKKKSA